MTLATVTGAREDRLLPTDPSVHDIARRLYNATAQLPVLSPHGHVPAQWLAQDRPFTDPTSLLLSPDHYIFRLLHADGVPLDVLGVGGQTLDEAGARRAWRLLCERWYLFRGTPSRYWMESVLSDVFGTSLRPAANTADELYDHIAGCLGSEWFRPRALFQRFGIEVLATTDDPCDDLAFHHSIAQDIGFPGRVLPTFRPDRYLEPGSPKFPALMRRLAEASGEDTGDFAGYLRALAARRAYFVEHGAVSADHSHADVVTLELEPHEAGRIFAAALRGEVTAEDALALRRHMLVEMARMSVEDGLVMTLHPGITRNHHTPTFDGYGPDSGNDIPHTVEFTRGLRPLLERFGTAETFHLVTVHRRRDDVLARDRAYRGLLPRRVCGRPVVVPGRAGGDQPVPRRRHRNRRLLSDVGVHRRHAGVLLYPRPTRHVAPARRRLSRQARRGTPPGRG